MSGSVMSGKRGPDYRNKTTVASSCFSVATTPLFVTASAGVKANDALVEGTKVMASVFTVYDVPLYVQSTRGCSRRDCSCCLKKGESESTENARPCVIDDDRSAKVRLAVESFAMGAAA